MTVDTSPAAAPLREGAVRFGCAYAEGRFVVMPPRHRYDQHGTLIEYTHGKTAEFHRGFCETDDPEIIAFLRASLGSVLWEIKAGEALPTPEAVEISSGGLTTASVKTEGKLRCKSCGKVLGAAQMTMHMRTHLKDLAEPVAAAGV